MTTGIYPVRAAATCAVAALFLAASAPAADQAGGTDPPCAGSRGSAIVIDDTMNTSPWTRDQMRIFRLDPPAQTLLPLVRSSGCFDILDADPVFAQLAESARPRLIVRARVADLKAAERGLGEKADLAVRRYLGSYLGGSEDAVPALGSASTVVEVLCVRERRVALEASGESASGTASPERNGEVLTEALRNAYGNLLERLRTQPPDCTTSGLAPAFPSP